MERILKPYIALDIETTGVDPNTDLILQISMVYENWRAPIEQLPYTNFIVDPKSVSYRGKLRAEALLMNMWIFEELAKKESEYTITQPEQAINMFQAFVRRCYKEAGETKLCFAGKNVGSFDLQFLKNNGYIDGKTQSMIAHRTIDIGSLYFTDYGYIPSSDEMCAQMGLGKVPHRALEDNYVTIQSIRYKMEREGKQ